MKNNEMAIEVMDSLLIKIYGIKDIEEIHITDLVPSSREGKLDVLPSLFIMYDGGKYLSLCSQDKYFDVFVRKVFQVYNLEKDREIVDPRFNPFGTRTKIRIDDYSKSILESGELTLINEIYRFYDNKKSYENNLLFQEDEFRILLPIIKYHLKQLFDCTDRVITLDSNNINGYRSNYTLDYKIDGIDDLLLINYVSNGNEMSLYIRSRDRKFKPLRMTIGFKKNSIETDIHFEDYMLHSSNIYRVKSDNTLVQVFRVTKNGLPIIYKNQALEKCNNALPNITGNEEMVWYRLPWNAIYGVNDVVEHLSEVDQIVMTHNKYLAISGEEFMLREYASKEYRRKKTFDANANRMIMDEVNKRVFGILLDSKEKVYVLETYFADMLRGNGYYDTYLNDRYFYHLTQSKDGLLSLNKNNLVTISTDNNIVCSADLLVKEDIKRLVKGE